MTNREEILSLIMELGTLLPDDFVWSKELRSKFERVEKALKSNKPL